MIFATLEDAAIAELLAFVFGVGMFAALAVAVLWTARRWRNR